MSARPSSRSALQPKAASQLSNGTSTSPSCPTSHHAPPGTSRPDRNRIPPRTSSSRQKSLPHLPQIDPVGQPGSSETSPCRITVNVREHVRCPCVRRTGVVSQLLYAALGVQGGQE